MKIQKTIFYILMFLPLPVTLIFPFVIIMFWLIYVGDFKRFRKAG